MDHYLDIRLRLDPEFPSAHVLNALCSKLHRALVQLDSRDIGISFPEVDPARPSLGRHLRLHGTHVALQRIHTLPWLDGMRDHVQTGEVSAVPTHTEHRHVCRVQVKSGVDRLRRRQMRRHDLSLEQARERIPDHVARVSNLPYLSLRSQSTRQNFRLFLEHRPAPSAIPGPFNNYGLSQSATIPWF